MEGLGIKEQKMREEIRGKFDKTNDIKREFESKKVQLSKDRDSLR